MEKYKATNPDVEVSGQSMLSVVAGMLDEVQPILDKYGIEAIDPEGWYPQQVFIDMFKELQEAKGANMYNLISIGMLIPENAPFPPDINDIPSALASLHTAYHMNHRNDVEERGWVVEEPEEGVYIAKSNSPYPHNFEYGIVYGMCKRFAPEDADWIVEIAEQTDEHGAYKVTVR
ncbi:MAG: hypothetical protein ACFB51_13800 [Anaerolineae bacterium]